MFEGLFQPMHLLVIGGCGIAVLALLAVTWLAISAIQKARSPASKDRSLEDRLAQLARLKEQGLVSEDEYRVKRQQLLDEI